MKSQPRPSRRRVLGLLAGLVGLTIIVVACGKKGPPLAPLLRLPVAVGEFAGRRLGSTVYLRVKVPEANQDGTRPADIARVEIYAFNGIPAKADEVVKAGTVVATIPVRRPPSPEGKHPRGERGAKNKNDGKPAKPAPPPPPPEPGFDQGTTVTVTDEITSTMLVPTRTEPTAEEKKASRGRTPARAAGEEPAQAGPATTRVYVAVGFNHRGRRGVISPQIAIPLSPPGDAPSAPGLKYDEHAVTLTWTPPAGLRQPMQEPGGTKNLPSRVLLPSAMATRYNVYEVAPEAAKTAAAAKGTAAPPPPLAFPMPLNDKPLDTPTFEDPRVEFGTERCYVVRTVDGTASVEQESAPSAKACVSLRDVFPPAAPKGLAAVWSNGGVSLNWEPNSEADLAGYLVMRGEASGGPLQPLMQEPIHTTTWLDTTVRAGVRYVYAVVAVDTAKPPNGSPLSNKVEETARGGVGSDGSHLSRR